MSQSTPSSRPSPIDRNSSSRDVDTISIQADAPASRMAEVRRLNVGVSCRAWSARDVGVAVALSDPIEHAPVLARDLGLSNA